MPRRAGSTVLPSYGWSVGWIWVPMAAVAGAFFVPACRRPMATIRDGVVMRYLAVGCIALTGFTTAWALGVGIRDTAECWIGDTTSVTVTTVHHDPGYGRRRPEHYDITYLHDGVRVTTAGAKSRSTSVSRSTWFGPADRSATR